MPSLLVLLFIFIMPVSSFAQDNTIELELSDKLSKLYYTSNLLNNNLLLMLSDTLSNYNKVKMPPLNLGRIGNELWFGTFTGFIFGLGATWIIYIVEGPKEIEDIAVGVVGFLIGYPLGSSIGVYMMGSEGNEAGSYSATLSGSLLGGLAGLRMKVNWGFWVLPPLGATIGFNMTRRYE